MPIKDNLFKLPPTEYGDAYQAHLLEQYKLFVESADRISQRRQNANSFFLTINTALLAFLGSIASRTGSEAVALVLWLGPVSLAGMILCYVWYRLVLSYKDINSAKFDVIRAIEQHLPAAIFDTEWQRLGEGRDPKKYKPFSEIETWIPRVFLTLYVSLVGLMVIERMCNA